MIAVIAIGSVLVLVCIVGLLVVVNKMVQKKPAESPQSPPQELREQYATLPQPQIYSDLVISAAHPEYSSARAFADADSEVTPYKSGFDI